MPPVNDVRALAPYYCDAEIGERLGCHPDAVRAVRKRHGIPSVRAGGHYAACLARRRGSIVPAFVARRAATAGAYGLPPDLTAVEVQVVVALGVIGPATTARLAAAVGTKRPAREYFPGGGRVVCGRPKRHPLKELTARGLIVPILRGNGFGKGRAPTVWTLSVAALNRLSRGAP